MNACFTKEVCYKNARQWNFSMCKLLWIVECTLFSNWNITILWLEWWVACQLTKLHKVLINNTFNFNTYTLCEKNNLFSMSWICYQWLCLKLDVSSCEGEINILHSRNFLNILCMRWNITIFFIQGLEFMSIMMIHQSWTK
jgi:hypothetical protein